MSTTTGGGSSIPDPTDHVRTRWVQRVGVGGPGPLAAWLDADPFECEALHGEEFRYHADSNSILIRKGRNITTVIHAETARNGAKRAIEDLGHNPRCRHR